LHFYFIIIFLLLEYIRLFFR